VAENKQVSQLSEKIQKTLAFHGAQARRTMRYAWWALRPAMAQRPVFVVGCSRAGTTLVYKILSESAELGTLQRETHDYWVDLHPLARKGWATHALAAQDATDVDRATVSRYFYAWTGQRRWVDKNNQNGLCIPYLQALFPDACFVFVKRSAGDNLNSLIEGWGKPEEFSTWSEGLPAEVRIDGGRYRRWCFFLAEGWRQYLDAAIEEVAAFQYGAMNEAILTAKHAVPDGQWVEIFYEDILRDPVAAFRQVFEHCGLQFDSRLQAHCRNVLDTPYNAFSAIRLDKWKDGPNRDRIERIMPSLETVVRALGYDGTGSAW
jgi:hypothetical protein